jgi:predicted transcriptional regulator of viral defense system
LYVIYRDAQKSLSALYATATKQGGYFTAKQAAAAGYDYPHLVYHVHAGNFERVGQGLYRLPTIPFDEHDDLIRFSLWSRDREDHSQAVVSHSSALFLHELSDILPTKVHLTVPPPFRKTAPHGCQLHKARLDDADVEMREGFALTTPMRTLLDAARDPSITDEQLEQAIQDAVRRGLVREAVLRREWNHVRELLMAMPVK